MHAQRCTTHIKRRGTRGKEIDLLCRQRKRCMRRQCVCWLAGPESDEAPDSLYLTADTACTHLTDHGDASSPLCLVCYIVLHDRCSRSQRVQRVLASWQIFPGNIASAHRLCLTFSASTVQLLCVVIFQCNTPVKFDS